MDDVGLVLQGAADAHERECLDGDAEPFIDVLPQDDVDEAGFVFEGHEDDAFGGLGPLAADDDAGVVHAAAVGHSLYGGGVGKALGGDLGAQVGQRMAPRAMVGGAVIPDDGFEVAQGLERDRCLGGLQGERVASGRLESLDLPEGLAPPGGA